MNYILVNLKLILTVAAIASAPSIYFATRQKTPTMEECRALYAKEQERDWDNVQKTVKLNDGMRW